MSSGVSPAAHAAGDTHVLFLCTASRHEKCQNTNNFAERIVLVEEDMELPALFEVDDRTYACLEAVLSEGDLFVQCIRKLNKDAESLVRQANEKFRIRDCLQTLRRSGAF